MTRLPLPSLCDSDETPFGFGTPTGDCAIIYSGTSKEYWEICAKHWQNGFFSFRVFVFTNGHLLELKHHEGIYASTWNVLTPKGYPKELLPFQNASITEYSKIKIRPKEITETIYYESR